MLICSQIEREVVLSSGDKNSKIPILQEYKQRGAGRVAIAPDAPIKHQAWVQEVRQNCMESRELYPLDFSFFQNIKPLSRRLWEQILWIQADLVHLYYYFKSIIT